MAGKAAPQATVSVISAIRLRTMQHPSKSAPCLFNGSPRAQSESLNYLLFAVVIFCSKVHNLKIDFGDFLLGLLK